MFFSGRDRQFYVLLMDAAQNVVDTAELFLESAHNPAKRGEYASRIKDLERKGDRFTHGLITLLNKMFVTPLDREDILTLAVRIDDLVDGMEAAAARMAIYRIEHEDRYVAELVAIIHSQAREIVAAMQRLQAKDLQGMRENAVQINVLENQGDEILRKSLGHLFDTVQDPLMVIKLKEIYETLETVTDRAEDVANVLESVVMKNA